MKGAKYYECYCEDLVLGRTYLINVLNSEESKVLVGTFDGLYKSLSYATDAFNSTGPGFEKADITPEGIIIYNLSYNGGEEANFGELVSQDDAETGYAAEHYYGIFANVKEINIPETKTQNDLVTENYVFKGDTKNEIINKIMKKNIKRDKKNKIVNNIMTKIIFTGARFKIDDEFYSEDEFYSKEYKFYDYAYLDRAFLTSETNIEYILRHRLPENKHSTPFKDIIRSYLEPKLKGGGERKKRNLKSRKTKNRNRRTVKLVNK